MAISSPMLRKFSFKDKNKPFRIVILGQNGVGKSALTVRYLTQRFIGDYDPFLENTYSCTKTIDGETVSMEIRDTAAQEENSRLESNIKWADAFVLVYAVTDRCSFNECTRLTVLINSYSKRTKSNGQNGSPCMPAVLVGNKIDREQDRMVSKAEGLEKASEMNCLRFYEISVREDRDCGTVVLEDVYRHCCKKTSRRTELQKRLSCPPPSTHDKGTAELNDVECTSVPLQRRRKALHTIS